MALHLATLKRIRAKWIERNMPEFALIVDGYHLGWKHNLLHWARGPQICGPLSLYIILLYGTYVPASSALFLHMLRTALLHFPPFILEFSSFPAPPSTPSVPLILHSLSPPYIPRFPSSPYHFYILSSSSSIHFLLLLFSRVFSHFTFNFFSILIFISCNFVHTFYPFAFTFFISSLYNSFYLFSLTFLHSLFVFFYTFSLFIILPRLLTFHL